MYIISVRRPFSEYCQPASQQLTSRLMS